MIQTRQETAVARGLPFTRWHLVATVAITALGFPVARELADADVVELYVAAISLMGMVGLAIVSFVGLIAEYNRLAHRTGRLVFAIHDVVSRHVDFLFDNGWLASNTTIRHALLPSLAELRIMLFHPSMAKHITDCREGTSWMMQEGGARAGGAPSMKLAPELEATRHYAARLEELRRENFNLKAELQILRRQHGLGDDKAGIQ